jgi:hypothetical protein
VKNKTYISKTKTTKKKLALATTTNFCDPTMPPIRNLENAKKMVGAVWFVYMLSNLYHLDSYKKTHVELVDL